MERKEKNKKERKIEEDRSWNIVLKRKRGETEREREEKREKARIISREKGIERESKREQTIEKKGETLTFTRNKRFSQLSYRTTNNSLLLKLRAENSIFIFLSGPGNNC